MPKQLTMGTLLRSIWCYLSPTCTHDMAHEYAGLIDWFWIVEQAQPMSEHDNEGGFQAPSF